MVRQVSALGGTATLLVSAILVSACGEAAPEDVARSSEALQKHGQSETFSTLGPIDPHGEFFQAQGTNGRSCATCHLPSEAWSITPRTIRSLFAQTRGLHPIFNPLDADNPDTLDASSLRGRRQGYSMMLSRGVFRRGGAPRAGAEWELVAVDDPHGFANLNRLVQWRRALPTIDFPLGSATVNWDGGNSIGADQRAGLVNQATRNVTGGQQGEPAPAAVIEEIVDFESSLFTTRVFVPGVGRLDECGAEGSPELLARQEKRAGRWDLFDAWLELVPGRCSHRGADKKRAQIARGQELFNAPKAPGGSCAGCHDSANNGTNVQNRTFDIGTASAEARTPDLPLYTFRNRATGETRQLSDAGRGQVTGLWSDLGAFKTPTLRALAARAPYFHNGIAETLDEVIDHYEAHLGFVFTERERRDLLAFLEAL